MLPGWRAVARYGALFTPLVLVAAPSAIVPALSFAVAGVVLLFQFSALDPAAHADSVSFTDRLPHVLVCIGVLSATVRRARALWIDDIPFIPRLISVVIPSAQSVILIACTLGIGTRRLRMWLAARVMLLGCGIVGVVGNMSLRLLCSAPPSLGFTPAGCSFAASMTLWSCFMVMSCITDERWRITIHFLVSSTPLRHISEAQLSKLDHGGPRVNAADNESMNPGSINSDMQGPLVKALSAKLPDFGEKFRDEDFETVDWLGRGSFGSVELCSSRSSGELLVVKRVHLDVADDMDELVREVSNGAKLRHPHIVRLYSASVLKKEHGAQLNILLEYAAGGTLHARIQKAVTLSLSLQSSFVSAWIGQLAAAVEYMHSQSVLHRDLTASNVLIKEGGSLLIGDLGLSKTVSLSHYSTSNRGGVARSCVGTPAYMSPELIRNDPYGAPSDVWALGVIVFLLLALHLPFKGSNPWNSLLLIMNGSFDEEALAALEESSHPPHLRALPTPQHLLNPDASKRMSLDELLKVCPFPTDERWKSDQWYVTSKGATPGGGVSSAPTSIIGLGAPVSRRSRGGDANSF